MEIQQITVCGIFAALIGALLFTRFKPILLFTLALVALAITGSISFNQILNNAVNPGVITLLLILTASGDTAKARLLKNLNTSNLNQQKTSRDTCFLT